MESPHHERQAIESYLESQSGPEFRIEHVEKLSSERVFGQPYDVWDAHTNEGRWWVVTNPINLYSQESIKSMDVALSFHIGLMTRVRELQSRSVAEPAPTPLLDSLRRLDVADDALDLAVEVEDFQAVGMRLREALVSLAGSIASLDIFPSDLDERPKAADFKGWAALGVSHLAPGSTGERLRPLISGASTTAWAYVNELTHARNATRIQAQIAQSATSHAVELFALAIARWKAGDTARCPRCISSRIRNVYDGEDSYTICDVCGWSIFHSTDATEPGDPTTDASAMQHDEMPAPEGECVILDSFGSFLTPRQALEELQGAALNSDDGEDAWANPFAVTTEIGGAIDVHRATLRAYDIEEPVASELVYSCRQDSCINPSHAKAVKIPNLADWKSGVITEVMLGDGDDVQVSISSDDEVKELQMHTGHLLRLGVGDVSQLLERLIFFRVSANGVNAEVIVADRRTDYSQPSQLPARKSP